MNPNPYINEDLQALAESVRRFADEKIKPGFLERDKTREFDRALLREMGDLGFICPEVPEEFGGLGMGFTLAAALQNLGKTAEVEVAELVPGVVEWNRGPLGAKAGYPILDPRTRVIQDDVANCLKNADQRYDAIMLDVDNGPEGLTQKRNGWLYSAQGLQRCHQALRAKGVLAVWSASADRQFSEKVRKAGFKVEEVQVYAHGNKGTKHTLWIGSKLKA